MRSGCTATHWGERSVEVQQWRRLGTDKVAVAILSGGHAVGRGHETDGRGGCEGGRSTERGRQKQLLGPVNLRSPHRLVAPTPSTRHPPCKSAPSDPTQHKHQIHQEPVFFLASLERPIPRGAQGWLNSLLPKCPSSRRSLEEKRLHNNNRIGMTGTSALASQPLTVCHVPFFIFKRSKHGSQRGKEADPHHGSGWGGGACGRCCQRPRSHRCSGRQSACGRRARSGCARHRPPPPAPLCCTWTAGASSAVPPPESLSAPHTSILWPRFQINQAVPCQAAVSPQASLSLEYLSHRRKAGTSGVQCRLPCGKDC